MSGLNKIISSIQSGRIQSIAILTGAGVSCPSGIPDFRSPGGLYDTLKPELLTASDQEKHYLSYEPTGVVDIKLFQRNQFPYLEVRRPFILGTAEQTWKPTIAHIFCKILHDKNLLRRLYTQNIDGLDHQLNLPSSKVVNIHGSLGKIECEMCKAPYPLDQFREEVRTKIRNIYDPSDGPAESSNIFCLKCQRPTVKPATVLYGCNLPREYFSSVQADFPDKVDLLIVAGTSLTVAPACNLVTQVDDHVPRLVVNLEMVGEHMGMTYGTEGRDVFVGMDSDQGFLLLTERLNWLEELHAYRHLLCASSAAVVEKAYKKSKRNIFPVTFDSNINSRFTRSASDPFR